MSCVQVEEDKKNTEKLQELVDKLQGKLKVYKRQARETFYYDVKFAGIICF